MQFAGVNKGVDRTELSPGESPDAANCFLHNGTLGLLGARKGKTFTNTTAFGDTVMGAPLFVSPDASRYWMTLLTDGTGTQENAQLTQEPSGNPSTSSYRWYSFGAPITQAEVWPGGASTTTQTLPTTIPSGVYEMFLPREFALSLTLTGGIQEGYFSVYIQFLDAGNNVVSNLGQTFFLDKAGDGLVVAAEASTFLKETLTLSGTATQVKIGVSLFPDGSVTTWSYSAGPFTGVLLRRTS